MLIISYYATLYSKIYVYNCKAIHIYIYILLINLHHIVYYLVMYIHMCVSPLSTIDGTPELQSKAFVGELQATLYGVNAWFLTIVDRFWLMVYGNHNYLYKPYQPRYILGANP